MRTTVRLALCATLLLTCARGAAAQTDGTVAIGANISLKGLGDSGGRGARAIGLLWRLGQGDEGWGLKYGVPWYSAEIDEREAGAPHAFGKLRVRPILIGYGYARRFGRTRVSGNMMGGYAINSFSMTPAFNGAYRALHGGDTVSTSVSNTFVVRPEVSTWVDLSQKVGLNITAGYTVARPRVTVTGPRGRDVRSIRADRFTITVGAVYSVF